MEHKYKILKNINKSVLASILAMGFVTLPALAEDVKGFYSGAAITTGANSTIYGDINARAAITLGADSDVSGNITAGAAITEGAGASYDGTKLALSEPDVPSGIVASQLALQDYIAQQALYNQNELGTTMAVSKTLKAGFYHATALTTTAGITLTFDGEGSSNPQWIINIDSYLSIGANLTIVLKNGAEPSNIIFNTGGYVAIGANSNLVGTIVARTYITIGAGATLTSDLFAGTYITTGADSTLTSIDNTCVGFYTTNGAITLGANSTVGSESCSEDSDPHPDFG
jgi:MSHA biogenesis protein MshQ